tara:strand:+ start:230 stop:436 length:207 start_codon:yes stop_codon:yes gene_type:complete
MDLLIMKLSRETKLYYLDYLQKQINKVVRRDHKFSLSECDQMLFMIMELKKEIPPETQEGKFIPNFHD